jgi:LuxR family maltose regulon positive regulatory protein
VVDLPIRCGSERGRRRHPVAAGRQRGDSLTPASPFGGAAGDVILCRRRPLLAKLEASRGGRLSLLIAPPGYGKSVLLWQWMESLRDRELCVLHCDVASVHGGPAAVINGLLRAVGITEGHEGEANYWDPGVAVGSLLLAVELSAVPTVLLLDHLDDLGEGAMDDVIRRLLNAAPDNLHIAIASRSRPDLPLATALSQGAAMLLDSDDLRITADEAVDILGPFCSPHEIELLVEQTGGWPAAVQLCRRSLIRAGDRKAAQGGSPGQWPLVADYVREWVFTALNDQLREFLLDVAVVDSAEVALADALRDRRDSAQLFGMILERLPGLVRVELPDPTPLYQIHPLVRACARAWLARDPVRRNRLHARASTWFARHGQLALSVDHAVRSGDDALLADLLSRLDPLESFLRFGPQELRAILHGIPPVHLIEHPRLQIASALLHFKEGAVAEARRELAVIRQATNGFTRNPVGDREALEADGLCVEAIFRCHTIRRDFQAFEQQLVLLRASFAPRPAIWAASEEIDVVLSQQLGDLNMVRAALDRAGTICDTNGFALNQFHLQLHEMLLLLARGELDGLLNLVATVLRIRSINFRNERPVLAMARIAGLVVEYERNPQWEQAISLLTVVETLSLGDQYFDQIAIACPIIAELSFRRGGYEDMSAQMERTAARLKSRELNHLDLLAPALRVHYQAMAGEVDAAEQLARTSGLATHSCRMRPWRVSWREREAVTQALIHLSFAQGQPDEARELGQALLDDATQGNRLRGQLLGLSALSAAAAACDDWPEAQRLLELALVRAHPQGYVSPFLEMRQVLRPAIASLTPVKGLSKFKQRQLDAVLKALVSEPSTEGIFNERQAAIAVHMAQGLSNKRIAKLLGITEHTVKFHLKKVFAKLQVDNRKDAAARFEQMRGLTMEA